MRIDKKLNLVYPLVRPDGGTIYVYSQPVPSEVFDVYWKPLGRVHTTIFTGGFGMASGPSIAHNILKEVCEQIKAMGTKDEEDIERGLMNEILRLTLVLAQVPLRGWDQIPFQEAVSKNLLDSEEAREVQNALVFFTVNSLVPPKANRATILEGALSMSGAEITSSTVMEYISSLQTSTEGANTGATAPAA